ncbi:MAG: hypothetical protein CMK71_04155 [Pseudomonadaceae bacterium]|nr:hypothetical protein [Pseudomonadaceae bacterium]
MSRPQTGCLAKPTGLLTRTLIDTNGVQSTGFLGVMTGAHAGLALQTKLSVEGGASIFSNIFNLGHKVSGPALGISSLSKLLLPA